MQINAHLNSIAILKFGYLIFDLVYLWMDLLWWILPGSVEVIACQITSEITINDTIYIDHRKNVEIIVL